MNTSKPLNNNRILIIDDNPAIHDDIRKILGGDGKPNEALANTKALLFGAAPAPSEQKLFEIDSAHQGKEGLDMVQQADEAGRPYAMAFVDVRMPPGWDGIETISRIWKQYPALQVVICTAYSDYSWADMIGQIGKTDSLVILKKPFDNIEVLQLAHTLTEKWLLTHQVKNRLNDLDEAVTQRTAELQTANSQLKNEIGERMQMEKALRLSEERFSKAFKASPIPLAIQSLRQETFIDANQGFQELIGFERAEILGRTPHELNLWNNADENKTILEKLHQQQSVRSLPRRLRSKSGKMLEILLSVELFELDGEPFLLTIAQDMTQQIALEDQLRQAQKMEAVGQLAAGVAHDFNNILTVILGHSSMVLATKTPDSSDYKSIQVITKASERAAKLVRQLLTFSRKQFVIMRPMDIGTTLATVAEVLPRVLPENIELIFQATDPIPSIQADAGMMEQMLMNLALNSRDAMPEGGRLTISAEVVEITPDMATGKQDARPGRFVCLKTVDTGCGMPPDVLSHIFEPFFTTKPVGKGTGLGLSTVYGIAKQHEGWAEVESQPGQGSTFRIFIPFCEAEVKVEPVRSVLEPARGGSETILVVEDEESVRDFVIQLLNSSGYQTISAESAPKALECWAQHRGKIQLLLTDMVMPGGLSGRELGERLLAEDSSLKVIYSSGYSPGMAGKDLALFKLENFIPKPYDPAKLLRFLRQCLDGQKN